MKYLYQIFHRENLTKFLQKQLLQSGKAVRRLLEKRICRVNGKVERFGSVTVFPGDLVEILPSWEEYLEAPCWKKEILLEKEDFLIVNKPSGLVSERRAVQKFFGQGVELVHRLDKETSGVFLLAKSLAAKERLLALFAERKIEKRYLAIVDGCVQREEGTIDLFLEKKGSFEGQTLWGKGKRGLRAITHWKVLKRGQDCSLVEVETVTGRTHQIRVSFASIGHPLLGDRQYARSFRSSLFAPKIMLHASEMAFCDRGEEIRASVLWEELEMGQAREFFRKQEHQ